jgi:asparagine synthase (glutamine-hydrolysing)
MTDVSGRYVIVYNGEIYNFKDLREELGRDDNSWVSDSDTEVILAAYAAWGAGCVKRLNGMFAFAIWDRAEKVFFAARDRMGIKPFYYHASPRGFVFASRPRAIFALQPALSRSIDEQALRYHLECGYIPAPYSIHQEIRKLPPAHYLTAGTDGVRITRYWDSREIVPDEALTRRNVEDLVDELDGLLSDIVREHMVSDVPVGAFLSGGIDSSLVAAMMSKNSSKPVRTFTIGFQEKQNDESGYASDIAAHLGTQHECEHMRIDDLLELLPLYHQEFDEPFYDSSAIATMAVSRLARRHVSVALSGDGGDELFGGYHYYQIAQRLRTFYRLPSPMRGFMASCVGMLPGHRPRLLSEAMRQKNSVASFSFTRSIAKDYQSVLNSDVLGRTQGIYDLFAAEAASYPGGLSPAEQGMRLDAAFTLPDDYLQKIDVSSMAFSLESRVPLLDHRLVEWAARLPLALKMRGCTNKYLLRRLAYRHVPRRLLDRPKMGFCIPLDRWMRGSLKAWAEERLADRALTSDLPLNWSVISDLWKLHQSGRRNAYPILWATIMLLEYVRHAERGVI